LTFETEKQQQQAQQQREVKINAVVMRMKILFDLLFIFVAARRLLLPPPATICHTNPNPQSKPTIKIISYSNWHGEVGRINPKVKIASSISIRARE
jgi:hypothetical protein